MRHVTKLERSARAFPVELCVRISCAFVGITQQHFAPASTALLGWFFLLPKALHAGPRLQQCSVNREVLIRQQILFPCLCQYRMEEGLCNIALQKPLPVLAEYRRHPDFLVYFQTYEPPEQTA